MKEKKTENAICPPPGRARPRTKPEPAKTQKRRPWMMASPTTAVLAQWPRLRVCHAVRCGCILRTAGDI